MENPEDLHVTILFGGDQLSRQEPLWNRATLRTAQALDPLSRLPMRDFFLERRRSILAIRFFGSDPFWKVVDGLATDLSGELLGLFSTRTFWPHMTLCRRIPPKMHDADCPMPRAHSPGDSPFFAGVRLYASPDPEERGRKRYITLSDFPFRQEQHGI
jgi:2'-5' RNA ligase